MIRRRHPAGSHPRCPSCGLDIKRAAGCDPNVRPTVNVWGDEPWWHDPSYWTDEDDLEPGECPEPKPRCPDCFALVGRPHHFHCDKAHCWSCDSQALGCDHSIAIEEAM